MNVAIISDYLPDYHRQWSGAELVATSLGGLLEEGGWRPFFVTTPFDFAPKRPAAHVRAVGTPLKRLGTLSRNFPLDLAAIRNVRAVLEEERADIVHINAKYLFLPALIAAARLDIPAVFTVPDYFIFCPTTFLRRPDGSACESYHGAGCRHCLTVLGDGAMGRLAARAPDRLARALLSLRAAEFRYLLGKVSLFIALSETSKQRLVDAGIGGERVEVAYHYRVGEPGRTSERIESPAAVFVGWLSEENGAGILIEAFAEVAAQQPDARLYLVGEGDAGYVEALKRNAAGLGIADNVFFLGRKANEEALAIVAAGDVVVVPHQWPKEFGPVILIEALALGRPVITSGIGAPREFVRDGGNGFIVDDFTNPAAFAGKIRQLFAEPQLAARMGAEAGESAALLSPERTTAKLSSLYRELMAAKYGRPEGC